MTNPAPLFTVWSPDAVAECLDGVSDDMYSRLWELAAHVPSQTADDETPDCLFKRALSHVWHLLTPAEKIELNLLAAKHEANEQALLDHKFSV